MQGVHSAHPRSLEVELLQVQKLKRDCVILHKVSTRSVPILVGV
jgi:hypothetical protein